MSSDFRETTVRVFGVERVVRTQRTTTVKALEAAHTKAVKAALTELTTAPSEKRTARLAGLEKQSRMEGRSTTGNRTRAYIDHIHTPKFRAPECGWNDARKGWPKVRFSSVVPDYLDEVAPGEYATPEAAATMTADIDETLPGLSLERVGTRWAFFHLASATDDKPHGVSLGPVFKTRERARRVAIEELAGYDWTRSVDELLSDALLSARVKFIKAREAAARKPSDMWLQEEARKAEEALSLAA